MTLDLHQYSSHETGTEGVNISNLTEKYLVPYTFVNASNYGDDDYNAMHQTSMSIIPRLTYFRTEKELDSIFKEIYGMVGHCLEIEVEIFLRENPKYLYAIKRSLELARELLITYLIIIESNDEYETTNFSKEKFQPIFDIEIWNDPEYDERPMPVLIIIVPETNGQAIFVLWEKIDELIYKLINPNLLITSVREH